MVKANPLSKLTNAQVATELSFPVDLGAIGHSVTFRASARSNRSITNSLRGQTKLTKVLDIIHLPMPSSLPVAYAVGYNNEDLTVLGAAALDLASTTANDLFKNGLSLDNAGKASFKLVAKAWKTVSTADGVGSTLNKVASAAVGLASPVFKAAAADIVGLAPNPHKVVLFQGVEFREHQFLFRLSPKNRAETNIITSMIHKFKLHMHPSFGDARAWLKYPDIFKIEFQNEMHLYQIAPTVLKSITIQYHPQGYPAYIRDEVGIAPAEIELNLTFQEIEIITKEFIEAEGQERHGVAFGNEVGPPPRRGG